MRIGVLLAAATAASAPVMAAPFDLANYQLTATYNLPPNEASEASAITYNHDTGTLFVVGDEGEFLVEVAKDGTFLGSMILTGFDDTEGLTYKGNGKFVIVEERIQDVFELSYTQGGSVDRSSLPVVSLGPTVGNVGLEGISYDPAGDDYVLVKEKTPQQVLEATIDFINGTGVTNELFPPNLGVTDLSDIQVLSTVTSLMGTPDSENLLIYSQEGQVLMEVTRTGQLLSTFDFSSLAGDGEGVTIDENGVIYVVSESPKVFVLTPIPEPASVVLLVAGAAAIVRRRRR